MIQHELSGLSIVNRDGEIVTYLRDKEVEAIQTILKMQNPVFEDMVNVLHDTYNKDTDKNSLFKEFIHEIFGSYYHILGNEVMDKKYIFRYLYLNTYTDYHGYIKLSDDITRTRKTKLDDNGERIYAEERYCRRSDLKYIFNNMTEKPLREFINYFYQEGMIVEDEKGRLFIPKEYAVRGHIKSKILAKGCGARMFDNGIKDMYNNISVKDHTKIDYIVKLIPYINFHHNVVCQNPDEKCIEKIIPLKQKDILEILQITKPTSIQLTKLKINNESLFCKITNAFVKNTYVVNPRFFYRGNDLEYADRLRGWFVVGRDKK